MDYRLRSLSGAIAQLVERLLCKQDVGGSNPSGSTSLRLLNGVEDDLRVNGSLTC